MRIKDVLERLMSIREFCKWYSLLDRFRKDDAYPGDLESFGKDNINPGDFEMLITVRVFCKW